MKNGRTSVGPAFGVEVHFDMRFIKALLDHLFVKPGDKVVVRGKRVKFTV